MIVEKESPLWSKITFEKNDWDNGKARKAMKFIKETKKDSGKSIGYYLPKEKKWRITAEYERPLAEHLNKPVEQDYDENDFLRQFDDE